MAAPLWRENGESKGVLTLWYKIEGGALQFRTQNAAHLGRHFAGSLYFARSFSRAAILSETQNTSIACRTSAMGGYDGAMRRLLSCGSLPPG